MSNDFGFALLRLDFSQTEVNVVLISGIVEVSQKPTFGAKITVIKSTSSGALSSGSKISFHGRSSRIENTDCICILGPVTSENFLEGIWQFFEGRASPSAVDDAKFVEPCKHELSCKN